MGLNIFKKGQELVVQTLISIILLIISLVIIAYLIIMFLGGCPRVVVG